jgi:phosphoribosylaminoimidazole-succinocarboxamide synthase
LTVHADTLRIGLAIALEHTDLVGLGAKIEGKVRDSYLPGGGRRILVTTDRISAFDRVLGTLPFKGQVLNQLSAWWFRETASVAPNHLREVPDPSVTVAIECEPLPVEWVMRAYLTGVTSTSVWTHYERGERVFCGHRLPDGLKKNEPLPEPILTPSTKAEKGGHDESVSRATLLERGVIDEETFDRAQAVVSRLFARGREICRERGLILVDTKYELGRAPDGSIVVIDEIHTPDSSRIWLAGSYEARLRAGEEPESFDKEYVRRWLAAQGFRGDGPIPVIPDDVRVEAARRYIEACDTIRGEAFVPDTSPPLERIRASLSRFLESV